LRNLGIEPYLIAGTLRASIAQRLVRKVCPECGGKGCASCSSTGFTGRTAVSEVLMVDDDVRGMIERGDNDSEIRKHLAGNGFLTLRDDAVRKISAGISTREEMMREGLA
jgi:type II secretory ATPase GspE/PulE/Tfp pilus assembly ATPase PilB-like protein